MNIPLEYAQVAVRNNEIDILKFLVDHGLNLFPDTSSSHKFSLLHIAVIHGRSQCIRYLLKKGAPLTEVGRGKLTPLRRSLMDGRLECTKLLLGAIYDGD